MFKLSIAISPAPAEFAPLFFAGEWERGFETAAELGFDGVEMSLRRPDAENIENLAKTAHGLDLAISGIATGQSYYTDGLSMTDLEPAVREELRGRVFGFVDLAAEWGAAIIVGGIRGKLAEGDPETAVAQRRLAVDFMQECADYALPRGVELVVEPINRYETNFLNTIGETLVFCEEVDRENLSLLVDTFHMNIEEASLADSLREAEGRIGYVHFADSNRLTVGEGHVPFAELSDVLRETGYGGYISLELLPLPDSRTAAAKGIDYLRSIWDVS